MATVPVTIYVPPEPYFWDVIAYVHSQFPTLGDAGLSGYFFLASVPGYINSTMDTGMMGAAALLSHDTTEIDSLFREMNATIQQRWPGGAGLYNEPPTFYDGFLDWYAENYDQGGAGGAALLTSRLLGRETLNGDPDALAHALKAAAGPEGRIESYIVAGKGTAEAKPRGGGNAVHPAWRTAYTHTCEPKQCLLTTDFKLIISK